MDSEGDPPNILIFMTDQHNAHALGCYGNPDVRTPNIDRLAAEGIVFDNAITPSGACRTAKMSILTGLHPRTHGLLDQKKQTPDVPHSLGTIFRNAGYRTAFFGKNHMPEKMKALGFERAASGPRLVEDLGNKESLVGKSPLSNAEHSAGVIATKTIKFIERHADEPFCVFSSQFGPHQPILPSEPWASRYDPAALSLPPNHRYDAERMPSSLAYAQRKWKPLYPPSEVTLAHYYGLISQIDFNVGRILDRLEELGLLDRTVIVFLSDHGELMGEHDAWSKEALGYEAVVRIPFIWRMPGGAGGGTRRRQLASSLDMLATLAEATGLADLPEMEGKSLLPILQNPDHPGMEFDISELFGAHHGKFCSTLRTERWKYFRIVSAADPAEEFLFDLEQDPWEMTDLSTTPDNRRILEQCRSRLDDWQRDTGLSPRARAQLASAGITEA